MKKLVYLSAFLLAGLAVTSCGSDDSSPIKQSPLIGKWQASSLSYTYPGGTNTHDFSAIKDGCAVDVIEFQSDKVTLTEEQKVEDKCTKSTHSGVYTDKIVSMADEDLPRQIISVNSTELVLKYSMEYPKFGRTDVEVKYIRK